MKTTLNMVYFILLIFSIGWGLECEEGEVDLGWGDCNEYSNSFGCMSTGCWSIDETTNLSIII